MAVLSLYVHPENIVCIFSIKQNWLNCGLHCTFCLQLIDKLSVKTPSGEVKLKVMKEIAKEYQVEWDTTESEMELLKPPEELIVCCFLSDKQLINY